MTTLLSIDPAAEREVSSTGWALAEFSDTQPYTLLDSGVIYGGYMGFCTDKTLPTLIHTADVVVCEKYVPYMAADPTPMKIEGVVGWLRHDTELQPASGKNKLVPDTLMKALGLWSTSGHHHDEREAIRHGIVYLVKKEHLATLKMIRRAR